MDKRKSQRKLTKGLLRGTGVRLSKSERQEVLALAASFEVIIKSNAK